MIDRFNIMKISPIDRLISSHFYLSESEKFKIIENTFKFLNHPKGSKFLDILKSLGNSLEI